MFLLSNLQTFTRVYTMKYKPHTSEILRVYDCIKLTRHRTI